MDPLLKLNKENQFYLHCLPEICTDPPDSMLNQSFYKSFKLCHTVTPPCQTQSPSDEEIDSSSTKSSSAAAAAAIASFAANIDEYGRQQSTNDCTAKLIKGPIQLTDQLNQSQQQQEDPLNSNSNKQQQQSTSSATRTAASKDLKLLVTSFLIIIIIRRHQHY
jgi:hypothetical protein